MKQYQLYTNDSPFPAMTATATECESFARFLAIRQPIIVPAGSLTSRFPADLSAGDMLLVDGIPFPIASIVRLPDSNQAVLRSEHGDCIRLRNHKLQLMVSAVCLQHA